MKEWNEDKAMIVKCKCGSDQLIKAGRVITDKDIFDAYSCSDCLMNILVHKLPSEAEQKMINAIREKNSNKGKQ